MYANRDRAGDRAAPPVVSRELTGGSVLLYTPDDDQERDTEWIHSDTAVSLAEEGGC